MAAKKTNWYIASMSQAPKRRSEKTRPVRLTGITMNTQR
jgi:hypothetical protein